jgi:hypothetical protein
VAVYHHFLRNVLPELLQDVDMQPGIHLWFMHDGAAPHFLLVFRQFLNSVFLAQWIARGRPAAWPVRSPDLNHWGHQKPTVFAVELSDVHGLQQQIQHRFETVCTTPGIVQWSDNYYSDVQHTH